MPNKDEYAKDMREVLAKMTKEQREQAAAFHRRHLEFIFEVQRWKGDLDS